jgi:hypothetical protein
MRSFFFLSNSCWNPKFHTFVIQVKVGLPEKTNPFMGRRGKTTAVLREGLLPIKNFGVVFCRKRPHFFLPCNVVFTFLSLHTNTTFEVVIDKTKSHIESRYMRNKSYEK